MPLGPRHSCTLSAILGWCRSSFSLRVLGAFCYWLSGLFLCLRQRHFSPPPFFPFLTCSPSSPFTVPLHCVTSLVVQQASPTGRHRSTGSILSWLIYLFSWGEDSTWRDEWQHTRGWSSGGQGCVSSMPLLLQCHHKAQPMLTYPEGCGSAFHTKTDYRRNTNCSLMNEALLTVPLIGCSPTVWQWFSSLGIM